MLRIRRRETVQNGFGRSFSQHTINGILSKKSVYFRAKMQYNKIRFRAYHPSVFSPKPGVKSRFLTKKIEVAALYEIDELLKQVKRIHMIGIGGAGMCPLAEILLKEGYTLTGSDNNESDNLTKLRSLGVPVSMGHRAENIGNAEMVVYTAALLDDNPELCAAKTLGVPTFERAKLFGAVTRMYSNCIGVCGTHGKTTVTSMLAQILIMAELDPSAVIGGRLPLIDSHGRVGHSDTLVCEACEFADTFLSLSPDVAVILNIDEDHLDYFKTLGNIIRSFHQLASMAQTLIINGDDRNTRQAVADLLAQKEVVTFGLGGGNDYSAANLQVHRGAFPEYDLLCQGKMVGHVRLDVPGMHNVPNSLAAIAAAVQAGATIEQCITGLESFHGAGRRFEKLAVCNGVTIADDYAHHPAELRVTLEAALKMGYNAVWAVFQPFTYSRTYLLMDDFAQVLSMADHVVMTEIMGSRERNTYNVYTAQLAEKIPGSVWFNTFDEVAQYVVDHAQKGDLVITLGCGDIYKAAKLMIQKYEEQGADVNRI